MGLEIETQEEYRAALRRIDALRGEGKDAESDEELAALEGAVSAYAQVHDRADERKGRPPGGSR